MVSDERVQRFLEVEEQASQLVEELAKLRDAAGSYSAAGAALDEAATRLGTTSTALLEVAKSVQATATALREIGTPELLRAQQAVEEQVKGVRSNLIRLRTMVAVGGAILLVAQIATTVMVLIV